MKNPTNRSMMIVALLAALGSACAGPSVSRSMEAPEGVLPAFDPVVPAPIPASAQETPPEVPDEDRDGSWDFLIQPYALMANIDGDASIGAVGGPVEVDFSDILENLQLAGMIHLEAFHANGWGIIFDYGFMDLGSDETGSGGVVLDAQVRQGIMEALVGKRSLLADGGTLDLFGGVRWWDIDLDLDVSPGPVDRDREVDWVDPVVGAKTLLPLGGKWSFLARGDVGGFGVESDFSWQADVGVLYRTSETFGIELHYRALGVDFEEDESTPRAFQYDTVTHGPVIGFSFFL